MYFLLSGEGIGDMGRCLHGDLCERAGFEEGPMAIIVDQLAELALGYDLSHLDMGLVSFVSERGLVANKLRPKHRAMTLPGKKKPRETKYFYENARALAALAKVKSEHEKTSVIAVLFRDSDGTASAGRGDWQDKRNSMIAGFQAEDFELGVAMLPKPKSEAWLLCTTKVNSYQHCAALESESGNDASPNSLKHQLENSLNDGVGRENINELLRTRVIDASRIDMPSFNAFKADLEQAVSLASKLEK